MIRKHYPDNADMELQIGDMVQDAVHQSINRLSGPRPGESQPFSAGGKYRFPARTTKEEFEREPAANSPRLPPETESAPQGWAL